MKSANFCLPSVDSCYLLIVNGRSARLCDFLNQKSIIRRFLMRHDIVSACFSHDGRSLALLDIMGNIEISYVFAHNSDSCTQNMKIFPEHKNQWALCDGAQIHYLMDNEHLLLTSSSRSEFTFELVILDTVTNSVTILYESDRLLKSYVFDPVRNICLLAESGIVTEYREPATVSLIDLNRVNAVGKPNVKLLFTRRFESNMESGCFACFSDAMGTIMLRTELYVEKYKEIEGVYRLDDRARVESHGVVHINGIAALVGYPYVILFDWLDRLALFSIERMETIWEYKIPVGPVWHFCHTHDQDYVFLPLSPYIDKTGKCFGSSVLMTNVADFVSGAWANDGFRL